VPAPALIILALMAGGLLAAQGPILVRLALHALPRIGVTTFAARRLSAAS